MSKNPQDYEFPDDIYDYDYEKEDEKCGYYRGFNLCWDCGVVMTPAGDIPIRCGMGFELVNDPYCESCTKRYTLSQKIQTAERISDQ